MTTTIPARLSLPEVAAVRAVAAAVTTGDGVSPLSEDAALLLTQAAGPAASDSGERPPAGTGSSGGYVLGWRDDGGRGPAVAGFALLGPAGEENGRTGELAVAPLARGHGLGRELAAAAVRLAGPVTLRLWAHGDSPAAARLAAREGFARVRELWRMSGPLAADPVATLPEGVGLRAFRPGHDEAKWLALNARAFADHPEQGRWQLADLAAREAEPWFDPAGFLLAERAGRLVGFHWTKTQVARAGDVLGEVYVVGVDPGERGTGLGRALTLAGLRHLRGRGVEQVTLYVDATNTPAVKLYESLGFARVRTDAMYAHPPAR